MAKDQITVTTDILGQQRKVEKVYVSDNDTKLNVDAELDMKGNAIFNVADPLNSQDVATKNYVDSQVDPVNEFIELTDTPANYTGTTDGEFVSVNATTDGLVFSGKTSSDFATAAQGTLADSAMQDLVDDTAPQLGGELDANTNKIINVVDPVNAQDVATKNYVDNSSGSSLTLDSGTYTPTITLETNMDSATSRPLNYIRIGNIVQVSGWITVDPVNQASSPANDGDPGAGSTFYLTLPIASNFTNSTDGGGVASSFGQITGRLSANPATNQMRCVFSSEGNDLGTQFGVSFSYQVL